MGEYEDKIKDLREKFDRLAEKYRTKRKDLEDIKDKIIQGSRTINPNFLATVVFSLVFAFMFTKASSLPA